MTSAHSAPHPIAYIIRPYIQADRAEWGRMRTALWPDQTERDMTAWLERRDAAVIVAERVSASSESPGPLCGFAEVGERSHADGCTTNPVAYLEGWYVDSDVRRHGVGTALVRAVEAWARARGLQELASDTWLDNTISQRAHQRLGFTETDRAVLYRKTL